MGCFLSCFRGAGSDPAGSLRDPLVRESRIGEAFLDDETKVEASGTLDGDRGNGGSVDEELWREANYLKSCGAIGETPPEMLKGSNQITEEETNGELKGAAVSEENLSEGFNCDEHGALKHEQSDSPHPTPLVLRGDMQTPGTLNTAYKESLRSGKRARTNKQFIYPVLRPIENKLQWMELRDDSSPILSFNPPKRRYLSTDCSAKPQESITNSMATQTARITPASFSFHDITAGQDQGVISPEEHKSENDSRKLLDDADQLKYNADSERKGVASLSCWLKPPSSAGGSQSDTEGKVVKQRCYENSVFTDLPIFTASGLNWDNDKPTPVLPKVWDGNGIPNTTTKYKEDQKVSWHATPFEERLMKVLSDEKPHHQRKISGKLIQLDEETN
uniref:Protein JASON n=1 Tax=Oryza nivara TaxID=4536 RepID=A0A0E0G1W4_ORYNI